MEIQLDTPNGPRVLVPRSVGIPEVEAMLPEGYSVHQSDWFNAVDLPDGRQAFPLTVPAHVAANLEAEGFPGGRGSEGGS